MATKKVSQKNTNKLRIRKITEITDETPSIKTFFFDDTAPVHAGQFVMVWVPSVDEVPMSVSYTGEQKAITVASVGGTTKKMHELSVGAQIGIRGPFGNGFELGSANKVLAVSGGCGSAPIAPVLDEAVTAGKDIMLALGARTGDELLFKDRALDLGITVDISTDDGTAGYHGFVTKRVAQLITEQKFDLVVACGPELMLKTLIELTTQHNIACQVSLERYMKCGIGICDACAINGYQVCMDGPVFDGELVRQLPEFGNARRDACGRMIDV
jgi:dihydroorotate dehydrogenase electron transfer subunit